MNSALIGVTGFVGRNLSAQHSFEKGYHSRNIQDIQGKSFQMLVCAGLPAAKWIANREPDADRANMERLRDCLSTVECEQAILLSTVDVYPTPIDVDEATDIHSQEAQPYGRHRLLFERFMRRRFTNCLIIRLPALFGEHLKKNAVYDLLHNNQVEKIHPQARFQFYNLDRLWGDVEAALRNELELVNFSTEPVSMEQVARRAFGMELTGGPDAPPASYDFRSRHAGLFGGAGGYLYAAEQVLQELAAFVVRTRRAISSTDATQPSWKV